TSSIPVSQCRISGTGIIQSFRYLPGFTVRWRACDESRGPKAHFACCSRKAHVGACSLVDVEGGESRRSETRCFRWRQSRRASASRLFLARRRLELHHILRGEKWAPPLSAVAAA